MNFPRGRGDQKTKHGISGGWGGQTGKTLRGGVWIFSGTTHCVKYTLYLLYLQGEGNHAFLEESVKYFQDQFATGLSECLSRAVLLSCTSVHEHAYT